MRPHTHTPSLTRGLLLACGAFILLVSSQSTARAQSTDTGTIVLWTSSVPSVDVHGDWILGNVGGAAGGAALYNPNRSRARVAPALSNPTNYFDMRFDAAAGVRYHLWLRMRAQGNSTANDSVHVQFSDAVTASGGAVARIGTSSSAEVVLQDGPGGAAPSGWGWADNGWDAPGVDIQFASTGTHVIRVQQREDGPLIDQIVLSPDRYATTAPGPRLNDTTILAETDGQSPPPPPPAEETVVLWASDIPDNQVFGRWQRLVDPAAAGGVALHNPNQVSARIAPALANPSSYFEATFNADSGRPYHVWVRMRAESDSPGNDSVHIQFDHSVDASGTPFARIGTSDSAEFVLQAGPGAAYPRGWGWTENGWETYGAHVFFSSTGTHRLRVQQREDGAIIDQIVISPDAYLTNSPGARTDDETILPATETSSNQPPAVSLTAPANGATFAAPATMTLTASASDPDNSVARVEFLNGTTIIGTDSSAPYSFTWSGVAAGTYRLTARAFDAAGASASSVPVDVTVTAPSGTWLVQFTASTDHNTSVSSYRLEIFTATADTRSATPIASSNLGKPTPDGNQQISVDRSSFFNGLAAGNYQATVAAVGSAGSTRSAPAPFTR